MIFSIKMSHRSLHNYMPNGDHNQQLQQAHYRHAIHKFLVLRLMTERPHS